MDTPGETLSGTPPERRPGSMNDLQRAVGVFSAPRRTFEDVAARPTWLVPLLFVVVAAALVTQLALPAILSDVEQQINGMVEEGKLSEDQAEQAVSTALKWTGSTAAAGAAVYTALSAVIVAAVLLFVGNVVLGGKAKFVQIFSTYAWSGLVGVVGYLVRLPLELQQGTMKVFLSPAAFLPEGTDETAVFRLLAALDIFVLWRAALVAVAFAAIYRLTTGKSLAAVGALYALLVIVSVTFAGAFGR